MILLVPLLVFLTLAAGAAIMLPLVPLVVFGLILWAVSRPLVATPRAERL
jgi:hypothetical protein